MRAVSVDALNPFGRPTVRALKLLRVTGVRLVLFDDPLFWTYYRELEEGGLDVSVVLTGQSFLQGDEMRPYGPACQEWFAKIAPRQALLGNEWNDESMDACWPPGGDDAIIAFCNEAAPAIRAVNSSTQLYLGGMFSDPNAIRHLRDVWKRLDPKLDGADYHPYQEGYEETELLFTGIRKLLGPGVGLSAMEWNDSDPDGVTRFQKILDRTTDHSAFFCYESRMVKDHGLIDQQGRKETWYAYRGALS